MNDFWNYGAYNINPDVLVKNLLTNSDSFMSYNNLDEDQKQDFRLILSAASVGISTGKISGDGYGSFKDPTNMIPDSKLVPLVFNFIHTVANAIGEKSEKENATKIQKEKRQLETPTETNPIENDSKDNSVLKDYDWFEHGFTKHFLESTDPMLLAKFLYKLPEAKALDTSIKLWRDTFEDNSTALEEFSRLLLSYKEKHDFSKLNLSKLGTTAKTYVNDISALLTAIADGSLDKEDYRVLYKVGLGDWKDYLIRASKSKKEDGDEKPDNLVGGDEKPDNLTLVIKNPQEIIEGNPELPVKYTGDTKISDAPIKPITNPIEFWDSLEQEDRDRLKSLALDLVSIIDPEPISAASMALTSDYYTYKADKDGFGLDDALGGLASIAGAIPVVGDALVGAKAIARIGKVMKVLGLALTVPGIAYYFENPNEIAKSLANIGEGNYTMDDLRNVYSIVSVLLGGVTAHTKVRNYNKAKDYNKRLQESMVVDVRHNGKSEKLQFTGNHKTKLEGLKNDPKKFTEYIKNNFLGYDDLSLKLVSTTKGPRLWNWSWSKKPLTITRGPSVQTVGFKQSLTPEPGFTPPSRYVRAYMDDFETATIPTPKAAPKATPKTKAKTKAKTKTTSKAKTTPKSKATPKKAAPKKATSKKQYGGILKAEEGLKFYGKDFTYDDSKYVTLWGTNKILGDFGNNAYRANSGLAQKNSANLEELQDLETYSTQYLPYTNTVKGKVNRVSDINTALSSIMQEHNVNLDDAIGIYNLGISSMYDYKQTHGYKIGEVGDAVTLFNILHRKYYDSANSENGIYGYDTELENINGTTSILRGVDRTDLDVLINFGETFTDENGNSIPLTFDNLSVINDLGDRQLFKSKSGHLYILNKKSDPEKTIKAGKLKESHKFSLKKPVRPSNNFYTPDKGLSLFNYFNTLKHNEEQLDLANTITPLLHDPIEHHRYIHGDLRALIEGLRQAANIANLASKAVTSDASLQLAHLLEALSKALLYISAGVNADDSAIKESKEKAWLQEKENKENRHKTAMGNRDNDYLVDREKLLAKMTKERADYDSTTRHINEWAGWILDYNTERKKKDNFIYSKKLSSYMKRNPGAYIDNWGPLHKLAWEKYRSGQTLSSAEQSIVDLTNDILENAYYEELYQGKTNPYGVTLPNWALHYMKIEVPSAKKGGKLLKYLTDYIIKFLKESNNNYNKAIDRSIKGLYNSIKLLRKK